MASPNFADDIAPSPDMLVPEDDPHDDVVEGEGESVSGSPRRGKGRKRDHTTLRKAPGAPKRFKSSYICFFMAKQPEIKGELGDSATVTDISKRSAEMWRSLPTDQRVHWDEMAAKDKQRYMNEKASYNGPWQVPWKRAKKDPSAPKRPMSAFLYFSQGKRSQIKSENTGMKNTEVSRLLGELWRNASEEERRPHVENEKTERGKYKIAIAAWRKDFEKKKEEQKKKDQERQAKQAEWAQQQQHYAPTPPEVDHGHYPPPLPYATPPMPGHYSQYPPPPSNYYGMSSSIRQEAVLYVFDGPHTMLSSTAYPPPPPPPGPYYYPINGKQPIILAPNGMPRYPPLPPTSSGSYPPPPPPAGDYGDPPSPGGTPSSPQPNYDFGPDQIPEHQTAE